VLLRHVSALASGRLQGSRQFFDTCSLCVNSRRNSTYIIIIIIIIIIKHHNLWLKGNVKLF